MSLGARLKNRVRDAVDTVTHGYEYSRHLVRGNKVGVEMSWTRPEVRRWCWSTAFSGREEPCSR